MKPAKDWTLVISGASAKQLTIPLYQIKGLSIPTIRFQGRLHIQMTIDANGVLFRILFSKNSKLDIVFSLNTLLMSKNKIFF